MGRKRIVYTMTFLMGLTELIKAVAPSYHFLFVAATLGSIFSGIREPAFGSLFADSTNPDNRALSYALWNVVPPLFGLMSPYIMGVLIDRHGIVVAMRWGYLFVVAMYMVAGFVRYRFLEETLVPVEEEREGLRAVIGDLIGDFRTTFSVLPRQLWVFVGLDLLYSMAWAFVDPYFVTYATEEVGLSSSQWGLTMTVMTVINILVRLPAASASDRYGRVKFIGPTSLMFPVVIYLFLNSRGFVDVLLIRLVFTVGVSFNAPAWQALFMDYAPKEHRGRFNAVLNVMRPLLWSGGTILGGYLYQTYSSRMTFLVGIGMMVVGALANNLFLREPEKREE
jgi:MFS family permease